MKWIARIKAQYFFVALAVLLIVPMLITGCAAKKAAEVTAVTQDEQGISPDTEFLIALQEEYTEEQLREMIVIEPENGFTLTQNDAKNYVLKPDSLFEAGGTVAIRIAGEKLAEQVFTFQVQKLLLVRSAFPVDQSVKVSARSGIEFAFNQKSVPVDLFKKAFSISPAVEGDFNDAGNRLVFYPLNGFEYGVKYTVTLADTLIADNGSKLKEAMTFTFTTVSSEEIVLEDMFQIRGNNISQNVLTDEVPIISMYLSEEIPEAERKLQVSLYRFDDMQAYRSCAQKAAESQRYNWGNLHVDSAGMNKVSTFESIPIAMTENADGYYDRTQAIQFPQPLEAGWYLAELTLKSGSGSVTRQILIQSSDLSVFYMMSGSNMLTWVNDTATGQPVSGAQIRTEGIYNSLGTTGADGTATVRNGVSNRDKMEDTSMGSFTVTAGDKTFVDLGYFYASDEDTQPHRYISYLYTDRAIYRTTDTIKVWGVVRPREKGLAVPKTVTVYFGNGMAVKEVTPHTDGTFITELSYENMSMDYWSDISLRMGDSILYSTNLRIEDYVKPVYKAESFTENPIYLFNGAGSIDLGLTVSLFDGTPASAFEAKLEPSGYSGVSFESVYTEGGLVTGADGKVTAKITTSAGADTWRPQQYEYRFSNSNAESESFYEYGSVYAVHRNVMLTGKVEEQDDKLSIKVATNKIDISKVKSSDDLWKEDILKGAPIQLKGTAEIHKVYYTKEVTGTYYDFVERISREMYEYRRHDDIVDTPAFVTENGVATISNLPESDRDNCYYVKLTVSDTTGKNVVETLYLGTVWERDGFRDDGIHRYSLSKQIDTAQLDLSAMDQNDYSWRWRMRTSFTDNETVTFALEDNEQLVTEMKGRILYQVVQDDYMDMGLVEKSQFTLPYDEKHLPNYVITGAYFDGKHVYALDSSYMHFDPKNRELELNVESDAQSYHPGEQVQVTAGVKNKVTGAPVSGATVVLSVVDEAIFALQEQTPDFLSQLYQSIYYPSIQKYTSYIQQQYGGAGEKGGGGGDDGMPRKDFKDTALFETSKTDAKGMAKFSFKLPDNITEWRLTALGLTPKNDAGDTKSHVISTKPFFVTPIINETILAGDDVTVSLRCVGTGIQNTDQVSYKVTLAGENNVKQSKEAKGEAGEYANVSFGSLKKGAYTLTIDAKSGTFQDVVQLPFTVADAGVEVSLVKIANLKDGLNIQPLRYPVSVTLYNKAYKLYGEVLGNVAYSYGSRTDVRIAKKYAAQIFKDQGQKWYNEDALSDTLSDVTSHLFKPFPYADADVELTAKALIAAPNLFPNPRMGFLDLLGQDEKYKAEVGAICMGEAVKNPEVQDRARLLLENEPTLSFKNRIYLAVSLAVAGDKEGAQIYYDKLVTPNLKEIQGASGEKACYVNVKDETDAVDACTGAASMLASILGTKDADSLVRYLVEKQSEKESYLLEQITYLTYFQPAADEVAKFSYQKDGKRASETLERDRMVYLTLTKDQLESAEWKVESGEVYANVYYAGAPTQTADNSKKKIGLTKTIQPVGSQGLKQGQLVKITITPDLSALDLDVGSSHMYLDDYVPSGMRFERFAQGDYADGWYLESRQGQRIRFSIYSAYNRIVPIVYYARCATPGTFINESAYINSSEGEIWGCSERGSVIIP